VNTDRPASDSRWAGLPAYRPIGRKAGEVVPRTRPCSVRGCRPLELTSDYTEFVALRVQENDPTTTIRRTPVVVNLGAQYQKSLHLRVAAAFNGRQAKMDPVLPGLAQDL